MGEGNGRRIKKTKIILMCLMECTCAAITIIIILPPFKIPSKLRLHATFALLLSYVCN